MRTVWSRRLALCAALVGISTACGGVTNGMRPAPKLCNTVPIEHLVVVLPDIGRHIVLRGQVGRPLALQVSSSCDVGSTVVATPPDAVTLTPTLPGRRSGVVVLGVIPRHRGLVVLNSMTCAGLVEIRLVVARGR